MTAPLLPPATPPGATRPVTVRRGALVAATVGTAAVCVVAFLVLVQVALSSRSGQSLDRDAMDSVDGSSATVMTLLDGLGTVSIGTAAIGLALCVAMALTRHRVAHALGAVVIVGGANVTVQVLKQQVLERPDLGIGYALDNSLPSGHTTVVLSLVVAALLVAPHRARLAIASAGALATTVTGASTVVADWHRPSDVLAALLVVPVWAAVVVLVLGWSPRIPPEVMPQHSRWHGAVAVIGSGLAGVLLLGVGVRPDEGWADVSTAAPMLAVIGLGTALSVGVCARLATTFAP
jgi:membrane-associated phospholipid phosphatase